VEGSLGPSTKVSTFSFFLFPFFLSFLFSFSFFFFLLIFLTGCQIPRPSSVGSRGPPSKEGPFVQLPLVCLVVLALFFRIGLNSCRTSQESLDPGWHVKKSVQYDVRKGFRLSHRVTVSWVIRSSKAGQPWCRSVFDSPHDLNKEP